MDVKAYIESGILETFALGQASAQETQEVACLSKIYPEIAEHLKQAEADLGDYAKQYQVEPPKALKQNILSAIADVAQEEPKEAAPQTQKTEIPKDKTEPKVIPLNENLSPVKKKYNLGMVATIFFAIALAGITFTYNSKSTKQGLEIESLAKTNSSQEQTIANINNQLNELLSPEMTLVKMAGTEKYPAAFASVYWNSASGDVILNTKTLAELPTDKQYQLWVLVDGNPVDMGVVPTENAEHLIAMKATSAGQHFAITIENKGGSVSPTLEEMVVFGSVQV